MTIKPQPPLLRIDLAHTTPVYRQIVDGLRALLVSGHFKPGDRLPTVRQLAIDLAVNHNTVAEAYRILEEEGWLRLRRHHGASVVARPVQRATPEKQDDLLRRLRELAAHAVSEGLDRQALARHLMTLADKLNKKEIP